MYSTRYKYLFKKISRFDLIAIAIAVVIGIIYVGNTLTPSSYGIILLKMQANDIGLVWGLPQGIRSDEWAVITPLTQATINNNFQRFNTTSFYQEDLRTLFALPLHDWGLLFKPFMWPYLFTDPAYAFSFYHYAIIILFIFGYSLLFRSLTIRQENALLLSLILFFTAFTQYWWTTVGPVVAYFPWLLIVLKLKINIYLKSFFLYYLITCWLISFFYPPLFISLGIVAILITISFFRNNLKTVTQLIWLGIALIAAAITAGIYLSDYIASNLSTVYPGLRIASGGLPITIWLSQFLPTLTLNFYQQQIVVLNVCEGAVVGTIYFLAVACFLNYSGLTTSDQGKLAIKTLFLPAVGFFVMSLWMIFPIPPQIGALLLFDRIPPERIAFAAGLLLMIISGWLAERSGLCVNWKRFSIFAGLLTLILFIYKLSLVSFQILHLLNDLIVLLPLALFVAIKKMYSFPTHTVLLITSLVVAISTFGAFNPLQSARPIFHPEQTNVIKELKKYQASSPHQTLVIDNWDGATLNGLGFKSFTHVLPMPLLDFWQSAFPELSKTELLTIFNRYARVYLIKDDDPKFLRGDAVGIPIIKAQTIKPLSEPNK